VDLPLLVSELTLTPLAAEGVDIELDGAALASGDALALTDLPLGHTSVRAELSQSGYDQRSYTFAISREGAQRNYLKADNTGEDDGFGFSVAAGDDLIVVGAPREDSAATGVDGDGSDDSAENTGAAYVFAPNGASFEQVAYLKPDAAAEGASFGLAVAASGDTVAVGAPDRGAGAVYVFRRSDAGFVQEARLTARSPQNGGAFGAALALHGDTLIVGAWAEDHGATQSGAVYVFTRSPSGWSSGTLIAPPEPQPLAWFGVAVAFDGHSLVAGATGASYGSGLLANGAAYVFDADSDFAYVKRLLAGGGASADFFGEGIGVSGDTIAVGAVGATPTAVASGAVYVFERDGEGDYVQTARLGASNPAADVHFGLRVVLRGDTLVATAQDEDSGAQGVNGSLDGTWLEQSGAAYLFAHRDGMWNEVAHIKPDLPRAGQLYGAGLALYGDAIVVGAQSEASAATGVDGDQQSDQSAGSGAVYVVR
jgi:hypothetical protein